MTTITHRIRRHIVFGWWAVLVFLTMGIFLETMHAFKVDWYLSAGSETRRLMWTLAHAHGVLIGVLNISLGASLHALSIGETRWLRCASPCLLAANVLVPGGFFLGGVFVYGGDPGAGVLLVPAGAVLLFAGVLTLALGLGQRPETDGRMPG